MADDRCSQKADSLAMSHVALNVDCVCRRNCTDEKRSGHFVAFRKQSSAHWGSSRIGRRRDNRRPWP